MQSIIKLDKHIFSIINGLQLPDFLDVMLTLIRNELFWIPVYIGIIAFFIFNYKQKFYFFLFACLLTTACSDIVSSTLIKKNVKRERPCNVESLHAIERVPCGNGYSFTSSHATNHFALSGFLFFIFSPVLKSKKWLLLAWAFLICFCQIYVGKHFPLDILFGGLLGITIGWMASLIFRNFTLKRNLIQV